MTDASSKPVHPGRLPETHLWTVQKGARVVDARVRRTPLGPQLAIYDNGNWLLGETFVDVRLLGERADAERRDYLAQGYVVLDEPGQTPTVS